MTTATPKKSQAGYYIHSAISLIIMFGFGQLPAVEPLTPLGMNLIGIFLGVLYGWIFVEIVWPSLAGLLALMLIGGMKPKALLAKSFGDPIVQMMFFIFVFCATISHYGLSRFISLWFISRSWLRGRPWVFSAVFLSSMFILGGLTSASPAAIIGWSILYAICDVCGYRKGEGFPTMMVFGIVFAAQIGMCIIPFKQVPLTVFGAYENISGVGIDYGKYMIIAFLVCALCLVLFNVMARYVFKPDMSKLNRLDPTQLAADGALNLNRIQKIVLFCLFLLVFFLLAPNFMPRDFFLTVFLKSIGNTGIVILLVTGMALYRIDGKPLLPFKKMTDTGVTWGIVLLLALVQPLSGAMAAPDTGITQLLMSVLESLFGGTSPTVFAVCLSGAALLLTQFMNNGAVGVAFMPLLHSYCQATGTPPEIPLVLMVLCVHVAFLTPAASASAALLHGNEWSDTRTIWKTAPLGIVLAYAAMALVTVTVGSALF